MGINIQSGGQTWEIFGSAWILYSPSNVLDFKEAEKNPNMRKDAAMPIRSPIGDLGPLGDFLVKINPLLH